MTTLQRNFILFLATGAGAGYAPWAPGTVGTLLAVPLSLGLNRLAASSLSLSLLTLAAAIACAIWLSTKGAEILGQKDPSIIVIDEIAGFLVAGFLAPMRLAPMALAFILFRVFDIVKLYPASRLERLPGGAGIGLDDVMAGLYTFITLRLLLSWGLI